MTALVVLLGMIAAWLAVGPRPQARWQDPVAHPAGVQRRRAPGLSVAAVLCLVLPVGVGVVIVGLRGALWGIALGAVLATGTVLWAGHRRTRLRRSNAEDVAAATRTVAGQLRIGAVPSQALARAARMSRCMERPAATQAIGGDVTQALRQAGAEPGREGLVSLARAWELSERTGAPVSALAWQVSEQVRHDRETERVVNGELAGPRATARILAFLPLVGIAMGMVSGGDPVGFLTGTIPGLACLASGVALACAGVVWTEHMADAASRG
ncbi:type II secretion system F family protein [Luteococcus sediminum]|uniref:type II secretion system F family protein n=1 Tax=Luteococcus sp. TaxID=1969402 RepID=UPI003736FD61